MGLSPQKTMPLARTEAFLKKNQGSTGADFAEYITDSRIFAKDLPSVWLSIVKFAEYFICRLCST